MNRSFILNLAEIISNYFKLNSYFTYLLVTILIQVHRFILNLLLSLIYNSIPSRFRRYIDKINKKWEDFLNNISNKYIASSFAKEKDKEDKSNKDDDIFIILKFRTNKYFHVKNSDKRRLKIIRNLINSNARFNVTNSESDLKVVYKNILKFYRINNRSNFKNRCKRNIKSKQLLIRKLKEKKINF
jgi:hypothetical protein